MAQITCLEQKYGKCSKGFSDPSWCGPCRSGGVAVAKRERRKTSTGLPMGADGFMCEFDDGIPDGLDIPKAFYARRLSPFASKFSSICPVCLDRIAVGNPIVSMPDKIDVDAVSKKPTIAKVGLVPSHQGSSLVARVVQAEEEKERKPVAYAHLECASRALAILNGKDIQSVKLLSDEWILFQADGLGVWIAIDFNDNDDAIAEITGYRFAWFAVIGVRDTIKVWKHDANKVIASKVTAKLVHCLIEHNKNLRKNTRSSRELALSTERMVRLQRTLNKMKDD